MKVEDNSNSAKEASRHVPEALESVISAKFVSVLAINARVPGSNPTIDGYFSTSLKAL